MPKLKKDNASLRKPREKPLRKYLETDIGSAPLPDLQGRVKPGDRQAENIIDTVEME